MTSTPRVEPKRLVGLLEMLWHAGSWDGDAYWPTECDPIVIEQAIALDLVCRPTGLNGEPPCIDLTDIGYHVIRSKRRRCLRALIDADRKPSGGHGLTVEMNTLRWVLSQRGKEPTEQVGPVTRQQRRLDRRRYEKHVEQRQKLGKRIEAQKAAPKRPAVKAPPRPRARVRDKYAPAPAIIERVFWKLICEHPVDPEAYGDVRRRLANATRRRNVKAERKQIKARRKRERRARR